MTPIRKLCTLLFLLSLPATVQAQDSTTEPTDTATDEADDWGEDEPSAEPSAAPSVDPLTARMQELVVRYYEGIQVEASEDDSGRGLQSVQMMVLSGIAIQDIAHAVDVATRLHTPGRRIPFEIAVPLRVGTTLDVPVSASRKDPAKTTPRIRVSTDKTLSPEEGARRTRVRQAEEARRTRYGLYRQWRERTRTQRTLISIGIPLFATSYITGFSAAGIALLAGAPIDHSQAWAAAIPLVGTAILAGITDGALVGMSILTILQGAGIALIVVGLAMPQDYPYDKDPTALRLGKKRDGRHALELRFAPAPTGGSLIGRF
jgi:hypothetical protein